MSSKHHALPGNSPASGAVMFNGWARNGHLPTPDDLTPEAGAFREYANTQAVLAVAVELRTANLLALADHVRTDRTKTALIDTVSERMGLIEPTSEDQPASADIPPAEDLEHAIEVLATDLWEADTYKNTPARTFGEDYANAQDRYRTMARAILAPEPVEPAKK